MDKDYETSSGGDVKGYQENENIFGGILQGHLADIHTTFDLFKLLYMLRNQHIKHLA